MAASANNIAATFATIPIISSSSSSSSTPISNPSSLLSQTAFAHPFSHKAISTSWNPHSSLPRSHKSSLLNLYGPPGPPPSPLRLTFVHRHVQITNRRQSTSIPIGRKLPNVTLQYLDAKDKLQTTSLSSLGKARRLLVVGIYAPFSPSCTRFFKKVVEPVNSMGTDRIACVAANDVRVMKAWGDSLTVSDKVMMLADGCGNLGCALGVRSRRFCLSCFNGVITGVQFDDGNDCEDGSTFSNFGMFLSKGKTSLTLPEVFDNFKNTS